MEKISKETYLEMKKMVEEYEKGNSPTNINGPYLQKISVRTKYYYNPKYGDNRVCKCGHTYDRHFDSYEDMYPIGCKYCQCMEFVEDVPKKYNL